MTYTDIFIQWFTLMQKEEGGVANRPKNDDPGGLTNRGVTWKNFLLYAPSILKIKPTADNFFKLTTEQVKQIAWVAYWQKFNVGTALPVYQKMVADAYWLGGGVSSLGYKSIAELNKANPGVGILVRNRLNHLKNLPNWNANKNGWTKRIALISGLNVETVKKTAEGLVICTVLLLLLVIIAN